MDNFKEKWSYLARNDDLIKKELHMEFWEEIFEDISQIDAPLLEASSKLMKDDFIPDYALRLNDNLNESQRYLKKDYIVSQILSVGLHVAREQKEYANKTAIGENFLSREDVFLELMKILINTRIKYYVSEIYDMNDIELQKEIENFISKQNEYYYRDTLVNSIVDEINEGNHDVLTFIIHKGLILYTSKYNINKAFPSVMGTNGKNLFDIDDGIFSNTKELFDEYLSAVNKAMKDKGFSQINIEGEIFNIYQRMKEYSLRNEFIKLEDLNKIINKQNVENINYYLNDGDFTHLIQKEIKETKDENGEDYFSCLYSIPDYIAKNNLGKNYNGFLTDLFLDMIVKYESSNNILKRFSLKTSVPNEKRVDNNQEILFGFFVKKGYEKVVMIEIDRIVQLFISEARDLTIEKSKQQILDHIDLEAFEREVFLKNQMSNISVGNMRKKI